MYQEIKLKKVKKMIEYITNIVDLCKCESFYIVEKESGLAISTIDIPSQEKTIILSEIGESKRSAIWSLEKRKIKIRYRKGQSSKTTPKEIWCYRFVDQRGNGYFSLTDLSNSAAIMSRRLDCFKPIPVVSNDSVLKVGNSPIENKKPVNQKIAHNTFFWTLQFNRDGRLKIQNLHYKACIAPRRKKKEEIPRKGSFIGLSKEQGFFWKIIKKS